MEVFIWSDRRYLLNVMEPRRDRPVWHAEQLWRLSDSEEVDFNNNDTTDFMLFTNFQITFDFN